MGVDPGATTGLCARDFGGVMRELHSSKNFSLARVVQRIGQAGAPVIVAADVTPAPGFVEKVAATFGARLFSPATIVPQLEKMRLVSNFVRHSGEVGVGNRHERDALVAALLAYYAVKNKLGRLEHQLAGVGECETDYVKRLVLQGMTARRAIEQVVAPGM